ncbi:MAG: ATP-binding protein [Coriobacteriia bacterium]|nr:ATP-binding protein [Coriobacteriia bacterium]
MRNPEASEMLKATAGGLTADALATLIEVSAALTGSLDLNEVLQIAIESAVRVLELDTGAIYTLEGDTLRLGATTPPLQPDFPEEYRYAEVRDHPRIEQSLDTGQPVHIRDAATAVLSDAERGVCEQRGLRTLLYLPLIVKDKAVGVIIVGTTGEPRSLNETCMDICKMLSYQVALAVANARLFREVMQTNAEIRRINSELEQRVEDRTQELTVANEELQCQAEELQCQAVELEEAAAELRDANEAKVRFLRSMTHELRTPLNSIIGFSHILSRGQAGPVTAEQERQLRIINDSGSHLLRLVSDVLDLARIDVGVMPLAITDIDAVALARDSLMSFGAQAASKGLTLKEELPDVLTGLRSDPHRLRQILFNLLGNAVKFTEQGNVTLAVLQPDPTQIQFVVTDTGPGIAEEHQSLIFGEFDQAPMATDLAAQGAGLGLAISTRLARALGGSLDVRSAPGAGASFTLTLPLATELDSA